MFTIEKYFKMENENVHKWFSLLSSQQESNHQIALLMAQNGSVGVKEITEKVEYWSNDSKVFHSGLDMRETLIYWILKYKIEPYFKRSSGQYRETLKMVHKHLTRSIATQNVETKGTYEAFKKLLENPKVWQGGKINEDDRFNNYTAQERFARQICSKYKIVEDVFENYVDRYEKEFGVILNRFRTK